MKPTGRANARPMTGSTKSGARPTRISLCSSGLQLRTTHKKQDPKGPVLSSSLRATLNSRGGRSCDDGDGGDDDGSDNSGSVEAPRSRAGRTRHHNIGDRSCDGGDDGGDRGSSTEPAGRFR